MEGGAQYQACAEAIRSAKALLITAGAGMGVDSGLPDFRGDKGFWKAYPMYERLGLSFVEAANPVHFQRDPAFGWGFYGHRTNLYRETVPHAGFQMLLDWIERFGLDHFVVTSNVDGQFQKAGFVEDRIFEVHGSIHHLQCLSPCSEAIWDNNGEIVVDQGTMRAKQYPHCISCGAPARPNVLMFGDFSWISRRTEIQNNQFQQFLEEIGDSPLVIIEMGAGTAIPTIRSLGERLGRRTGSTLIRINPRESEASAGVFSLSVGALEGLRGIATRLEHQ